MARRGVHQGICSNVVMRTKRILIFSLSYFPRYVGGAEIAIKEITDRIDPADIEFHMVTLRFDSMLPRVEKVGNVLVHRIGFSRPNPTTADLRRFPIHLNKFLFQFLAPFVAMRLHEKYRYDGAWGMMAHSCGVPTTLLNFLTGVPYVLTLQEGDPIPYIMKKVWPVYPLFVRAFRKAAVIQSISTFLARWAEDMGATCPIIVVPNAVDMKHFSKTYSTEELDDLKRKLGKKSGDVFLITTSRLVTKNAVDDVIRALKMLPDYVYFLVLGAGPDEEMLRALAKEIGVEHRVRFIGQIDHAELPKYLKVSDIFVRPSRSEGMGNSFVEAMAAGIPVIATQEGGIADFLFDARKNPDKETTGWAVAKNTPEEIAQAVMDILSHTKKTTQVVATAKKLVSETYDWNIIVKCMREKVFLVLLSK